MKKHSFIIKFIMLPLIFIVLSGCWSKKELDNLAVVTGLGIDVIDEGYEVTVQIINPAEVAAKEQTTRTAVSSYSATGKSVFEAIRNLIEVTPRKVYLSHTRIVIFSEELAEKGISETVDFLIRDHELRTDFYLAISKDSTAREMLNILTPLEKVPASKVYATIELSEQNLASTSTVKIQKFVSDLLLKGQHPFITGIYIKGTPDSGNSVDNVEQVDAPSKIFVDHIGVMRDDQLIGWLNQKESKGFNYLTGKVKNSTEIIKCQENGQYISFEVMSAEKKMKGKVKNGTPTFTVDINVKANIAQNECKMKLSEPNVIKDLEKKLDKEISQITNKTIETLQDDMEIDIIGFGEHLHRTNKNEWSKLKDQWDEKFPEINININVKSTIKRTGTITDSFEKKSEE